MQVDNIAADPIVMEVRCYLLSVWRRCRKLTEIGSQKWLEYLAKSTDQTDGSDALWVHGYVFDDCCSAFPSFSADLSSVDVFSWVYDIADGAMRDLNISRGPTTGFTEEKAEG